MNMNVRATKQDRSVVTASASRTEVNLAAVLLYYDSRMGIHELNSDHQNKCIKATDLQLLFQ